jgi:fluoroquinolone resistance protein
MAAFEKDGYERETFTGLSLSEETVTGVTFEECRFENCSFIAGKFESCRFLGTTFSGCVLSAVVPMNSRFDEVTFKNCKVIGIDWTRTTETRKLHFSDCQLNYSNFRFLGLPGLKIERSEVKDADFIEAKLKGASFARSDLEKTRFFKTDLTGADFRGAWNYSIDPGTNTLKKTRFSLPEAIALLESLDIIIE